MKHLVYYLFSERLDPFTLDLCNTLSKLFARLIRSPKQKRYHLIRMCYLSCSKKIDLTVIVKEPKTQAKLLN